MEITVSQELRRIAKVLDVTYAQNAGKSIEQSMRKIKKKFMEGLKKSKGLGHLDPEQMWRQMQDSIRREMQQRPRDWRV